MVSSAHTAPEMLSDQARVDSILATIGSMWRTEPDVAPSGRARLLERLSRLESDVDRLTVRLHTGEPLDGELVAACADEAAELRWWWRPTGREQAAGTP